MIVLDKGVFFNYFNDLFIFNFLCFLKYRKNYHCDVHIKSP
jgi:hypothetical protein